MLQVKQGGSIRYKLIDWHLLWFQEDNFKGCLFVRAVAESHLGDQDIIIVSKDHKIWIRNLIKFGIFFQCGCIS